MIWKGITSITYNFTNVNGKITFNCQSQGYEELALEASHLVDDEKSTKTVHLKGGRRPEIFKCTRHNKKITYN